MSIREFILTGIVAILLATFIQNAHADYTPPLTYKLIPQAGGGYVSGKMAVCEGAMAYLSSTYDASNPYTAVKYCVDNTGVTSSGSTSTGAGYATYAIAAIYIKTTGTTDSTSRTAGYVYQTCSGSDSRKSGFPPNVICNGTAPPPPPSCDTKKGQPVTWFSTSATGADQCIDSCIARMRNGDCGGTGADMKCYYTGEFTGSSCVGNGDSGGLPPTPTPPPEPSPCATCDCIKNGQSYGTVNGAVVCTTKGSIGSNPTSSVTAGSTSTNTPAPTPENPNPTPVTVENPPVIVTTTPPPAGSPAGTGSTITSSTTNPDGSKTEKTENIESFCKDNPTSKLCKAETQCQENPDGPTCKHLCDKFPDSVACKSTTDFIEELVGNPDDIPDENIGEKTVNIGEDFNFNPISLPDNSSCPSPKTMSIAGAPIVITFDWLCEYASAFKLLIKTWALFIAYGIVAAAIRGDSQRT